MNRIIFTGILGFLLLMACGAPETKEPLEVSMPADTAYAVEYRYEIFANIDSAGVQHGYGYDIYDGDKKLIHQTNIPGEPGIEGFVNENEASIIAKVVVEKLRAGGGFPTLSHTELIDYGITLKP